jgi:hypothetical protein
MTVTRGWNKIGADSRDHRNYQERESSDEKAKPFSKQMALPGVTNNHSRADGKKNDTKPPDERQVQIREPITGQRSGKKQASSQ